MDAALALQIENKVHAIKECDFNLKKLSIEDSVYTNRIKEQYLEEIKTLTTEHPELLHHPALLKINYKV